MHEVTEKRGPIEKGPKGWPLNPLGVIALIIFTLFAALFIVRPLIVRKTNIVTDQSSSGGRIIAPQSGDIIKLNILPIELSVDEPAKVAKVQFWVPTYSDGKWQMIGEV